MTMRILALDTSTRSCSVALLEGEELVVETAVCVAQTHSAHLVAMVEQALRFAGWNPGRLEGLAVGVGPGSFTGLRIGIATAKGIAYAAGIPCVGVGSLEALAASLLPRDETLCALIDARRGELYAAVYRAQGEQLIPLLPERATPIAALLAGLKGPHLFIGDGALLHAADIRAALGTGARFAPVGQHAPRAAVIGRLARKFLPQAAVDRGFTIRPRYLRGADAEALRTARSAPDEGGDRVPKAD